MILILTEHSRDKMSDLAIDKKMIKTVIIRGSKFKQTDGLKSVYGGIGVAYTVRGERYIIKTVMYE